MNKLTSLITGALVVASLQVFANSIEDRIKPSGSLCMSGESCASTQTVASSGGSRSGQEVYESKCSSCHATGAAGAPKLGDKDAWATRMNKGIETLYSNSIQGFNAMPAKGLCFDCSDSEIQAAVDHLVSSAK